LQYNENYTTRVMKLWPI